jgi:hypothetical protein
MCKQAVGDIELWEREHGCSITTVFVYIESTRKVSQLMLIIRTPYVGVSTVEFSDEDESEENFGTYLRINDI